MLWINREPDIRDSFVAWRFDAGRLKAGGKRPGAKIRWPNDGKIYLWLNGS
jgi:hypothetical protein